MKPHVMQQPDGQYWPKADHELLKISCRASLDTETKIRPMLDFMSSLAVPKEAKVLIALLLNSVIKYFWLSSSRVLDKSFVDHVRIDWLTIWKALTKLGFASEPCLFKKASRGQNPDFQWST